MNSSPPAPPQFLGLIMKTNIKTKRTVPILPTFLKSNSNSVLLTKIKQTGLPGYLKTTQFDFANAKLLLALKPGKKRFGLVCFFAVVVLFVCLFALALLPLAWIPFLR